MKLNYFTLIIILIAFSTSGGKMFSQTNTYPYPPSGPLGLGTDDPTEQLDVSGNINLSGAIKFAGVPRITDEQIFYPNGSANDPSYSFTNSTSTGMYMLSPNNMSFSTNGTERMRMTSTGLIYIPSSGTLSIGTSANSEKLTIAGNIRFYTPNSFIGTTTNSSFFLRTYNLNRMEIKGNGTVHIFTNLTFPVGANIAIGKADLGLDTDGIRIHYAPDASHAFIDYKDNLFFRTGNSWTTPLILQGNGAVAIGISSTNYGNDGSQYVVPSGYKLAVGGKNNC